MTRSVTRRAVQLAEDHFDTNLAFAFVGGSYARHAQKATSDIDLFVALHRSDRDTEVAFAQELRELHEKKGLDFEHCGEVFDTATLDTLLTFTEQTIATVPAIQKSACYQADCPLSVFRKGDVVFKFLADPKLHVLDPGHLLPCLEERASAYFTRWPMPRVQEHKHHLGLPADTQQADLAEAWRRREGTEQWMDTPVGVGLVRWFGPGLLPRTRALGAAEPVTLAPLSPLVCPLPDSPGRARRAYAAQCLAMTYPTTED
ncbi:nucleotidyltransferase domain-containing protein [Streptomyces sp. NPDC021020]|uniref:nucleotidyltransferase domain-containing protein n=1 Tax=Streptomyces sp. NPDC021020 TaxID=3365109 RepID=UPI0037AC51BC